MSDILHIIDINNMAYRGMFNRSVYNYGVSMHGGIYQADSVPMGVVYYIFNHLNMIDKEAFPAFNNYYAFCADSRNIIKKELYPEYKAQRNHDTAKENHLYEQMEYLKLLLRDRGFSVFEENGYEADDLAFSLWRSCYDYYDFIFFHVNDGDYNFMINSDKIGIIRPIKGGGCKLINKNNYEHELGLEYNMSLFNKLIKSDPSDNIKGIGIKWANPLILLARELGPGCNKDKLGDSRTLRRLIMELSRRNPDFPIEEANRTLDILTPIFVDLGIEGKQISKGNLIEPYRFFNRDILRTGSDVEKESLLKYIEDFTR